MTLVGLDASSLLSWTGGRQFILGTCHLANANGYRVIVFEDSFVTSGGVSWRRPYESLAKIFRRRTGVEKFERDAVGDLTEVVTYQSISEFRTRVAASGISAMIGCSAKKSGFENSYPIMFDMQYSILPEFFSTTERFRRKLLTEWTITQSDRLIIGSDYWKQMLIGSKPSMVMSHKIVPLPISVNVGAEVSLGEDGCELERASDAPLTFLVSSRLWKHKQIEVIAEAFLRSKEPQLGSRLVFTGETTDPRFPDYGPSLISRYRSDSIVFTGYLCVSNLEEWFGQADCLITASLCEGSPLAGGVGLALGRGIPVFVPNTPIFKALPSNSALVARFETIDELAYLMNSFREVRGVSQDLVVLRKQSRAEAKKFFSVLCGG